MQNDAVYEFMGANGTKVNLATGQLFDANNAAVADSVTSGATSYGDLGYWYQVPAQQLTSGDSNQAGSGPSASGDAVGGIVVVNEVHGGANAIVLGTIITTPGPTDGLTDLNVSGASLTVSALDNATISATTNATASSSGQSSFDSNSVAVNGAISINEILGDAQAYIDTSAFTTGDFGRR